MRQQNIEILPSTNIFDRVLGRQNSLNVNIVLTNLESSSKNASVEALRQTIGEKSAKNGHPGLSNDNIQHL